MMLEGIEDCPFCGSEMLTNCIGIRHWLLRCSNEDCVFNGAMCYTSEEEAIKVVNTRARMSIQHIIPLNDIKEHIDGSTCNCKPVLEELPNGDFLCIHNSWDNREEREEK